MKISKAKYICCKENGLRTAWAPTEEFKESWNEISGDNDAAYNLYYILVCTCGFHNDVDASPIVAFENHWGCRRVDVQRIWVPYLREHEENGKLIDPIPSHLQDKFLEALAKAKNLQ